MPSRTLTISWRPEQCDLASGRRGAIGARVGACGSRHALPARAGQSKASLPHRSSAVEVEEGDM